MSNMKNRKIEVLVCRYHDAVDWAPSIPNAQFEWAWMVVPSIGSMITGAVCGTKKEAITKANNTAKRFAKLINGTVDTYRSSNTRMFARG